MECAVDRARVNADDVTKAEHAATCNRGDQCTDDGTCTCGKPVKPFMKRVIAAVLMMMVTSTVISRVAAIAQYSVTGLVALILPEMADEDMYDEWSEFEAVVSPQSSLIAPPTEPTNATCLALEHGLPRNEPTLKSLLVRIVLLLTDLVSASLVMAFRNRFLPSYERLQQLATSFL